MPVDWTNERIIYKFIKVGYVIKFVFKLPFKYKKLLVPISAAIIIKLLIILFQTIPYYEIFVYVVLYPYFSYHRLFGYYTIKSLDYAKLLLSSPPNIISMIILTFIHIWEIGILADTNNYGNMNLLRSLKYTLRKIPTVIVFYFVFILIYFIIGFLIGFISIPLVFVLGTAGIYIGMGIGLIIIFVISVALSASLPAIMKYDLGPIEGIEESWRFCFEGGNFWRLFALMIIGVLVYAIPIYLVSLILEEMFVVFLIPMAFIRYTKKVRKERTQNFKYSYYNIAS